ncbi:hypothetical protein RRG08_049397 [Elysia crispata]|uniref:Uncharacterized protein n=1 Tax=Elysia crispata TaxID=231223 RepID=A0AAE0XE64_9GAST|nr:hypothetical protein RRG08_049397 [Elysia crispata]
MFDRSLADCGLPRPALASQASFPVPSHGIPTLGQRGGDNNNNCLSSWTLDGSGSFATNLSVSPSCGNPHTIQTMQSSVPG